MMLPQGMVASNVPASAFPLLAPDGSAAAPSYSFASDSDVGMFWRASNTLSISTGGTERFAFTSSNLAFAATIQLSWSSNLITNTPDVRIDRNAAGILDLHNGTTNSTQFNVWNTRTSASVGEWVESKWVANVAVLCTNSAGGGTGRVLQLRHSGVTSPAISVAVSSVADPAVNLGFNATSSAATSYTNVAIQNGCVWTATTGDKLAMSFDASLVPSASATATYICARFQPTINYASGGAGRVQLIRLAPTNTALPTGNVGALVLSSTAALGTGLRGIQLFTTSDETTNWERLSIYSVAADNYVIETDKGGSGTARGLTLAIPNAGLRINGQTTGAGAGAGTLANAPSAGDPDFWLPINIAGTVHYIPAWTA